MSVESVLSDTLSEISGVDAVYDTKMPDGENITGTVIVYQQISDVPDLPIDGTIIGRDQRWQVTVRSVGITEARAAKAAVIEALHGLVSSPIQWCNFESSQEFYEEDGTRKEYYFPIDFMISL